MNASNRRTIKITMNERRQELFREAEGIQYNHGMSDARAMNCFTQIRDIDDALSELDK